MERLSSDNGEVMLKHRFGGHGGIPTEWEITVTNRAMKDIIAGLPKMLPGVQTGGHPSGGSWIILPEGTPRNRVGKLVCALACWDADSVLGEVRSISNGYIQHKEQEP